MILDGIPGVYMKDFFYFLFLSFFVFQLRQFYTFHGRIAEPLGEFHQEFLKKKNENMQEFLNEFAKEIL